MKTIVLDRDGVINEDSNAYIKSSDEWQPIPGSMEAITRLHDHGYRVAVATNQSGLARGLLDGAALAEIHHKMCVMVEERGGMIEGIFFCPHGPSDSCSCRKPATGLLERIEIEFQCVLPGAYLIGDSIKDLQAATAFGMSPILVRSGKGLDSELRLKQYGLENTPVFDDLLAAVENHVLASHG